MYTIKLNGTFVICKMCHLFPQRVTLTNIQEIKLGTIQRKLNTFGLDLAQNVPLMEGSIVCGA